MVAPDHFGLQAFPLPSGQELDKALGFADDFRRKASRPQAIQGELDPGRILYGQGLQPVVQLFQEDWRGHGRMPRRPQPDQQQRDQEGEDAGKAGSSFQEAGVLTVGL